MPLEIVGDNLAVEMDFLVAVVRDTVVSVSFCADGLVMFSIEVAKTTRVIPGDVAHDKGTNGVADASAVALCAGVAMLVGKVVRAEVPVIDGMGADVAASMVVSQDVTSSNVCLAKPLHPLA